MLSKRLSRGEHRAERKSKQIGSSLEFADYRNYSSGDDLRNVDWNIYGRLDRLVMKLFEQEQDLHIDLLIDASDSMKWRSGPKAQHSNKLDCARKIAASLAYIGLANLDRVDIHWFGAELETGMGISRGKSQFHKVLNFLRTPPELPGQTRLLASLGSFCKRMKRRGLVFVLSDLFDPNGYEDALSLLRHNQFQTHVIQILDPAELRPEAIGDLQLTETETGETLAVTLTAAMLKKYHAEIDGFLQTVAQFCLKRGMGYAQASSAIPFEDLVLQLLRQGRMLK